MERIIHLGETIKTLIGENPNMAYLWIFVLMTIESTFVPLPSEIVLPPAGYFASKGILNIYLCILVGTLGSLFGALINYYIGYFLGEKVSKKIMGEKYNQKCNHFFKKNGDATIFISRLLLGIRHYISLPAGVYRMKISKFISYTFLGAFVWVTFLTYFGYFLGDNEELLKKYKLVFFGIVVLLVVLVILVKYLWMKRIAKKNNCIK